MALFFYALNRLAFADEGGPYPLWYSGAEVILSAIKAVIPGFAAGRLALACVYAVAGGGLTNALGGAAGESLSSAGEARTRR